MLEVLDTSGDANCSTGTTVGTAGCRTDGAELTDEVVDGTGEAAEGTGDAGKIAGGTEDATGEAEDSPGEAVQTKGEAGDGTAEAVFSPGSPNTCRYKSCSPGMACRYSRDE